MQVFFFRAGRNYGNRAYFPSHDRSLGIAEVLGPFVAQFYENKPVPRLVLLSHDLEEQTLIAGALALRAEYKVELSRPQRGAKRNLIDHAMHHAREAPSRRLDDRDSQLQTQEQH